MTRKYELRCTACGNTIVTDEKWTYSGCCNEEAEIIEETWE